jgi:nitrogen fixation NifU-like protein
MRVTEDNENFVEELQESILKDLSENLRKEVMEPCNIGRIAGPDGYVSVTGVCGDTVEMCLNVTEGRISDIKFMTDGCGFTIACSSYVTRTAKGKTIEEASRIRPEDVDEYFGGLPEENKHCAKLSVMTLQAVIENYQSEWKETEE